MQFWPGFILFHSKLSPHAHIKAGGMSTTSKSKKRDRLSASTSANAVESLKASRPDHRVTDHDLFLQAFESKITNSQVIYCKLYLLTDGDKIASYLFSVYGSYGMSLKLHCCSITLLMGVFSTSVLRSCMNPILKIQRHWC